MTHRREFLTVLGAGAAALALEPLPAFGAAMAAADPTWLAYAPDAETFWKSLPFLERLKKIAEAGFTRYEFAQWRTKDLEAIVRANEELGLQPTRFLAFRGVNDPKKKVAFVEAIEDSVEVAQKLNATRLTILAVESVDGLDRDEQIEAAVEALKEGAEKAAESEIMLILEPVGALPGRPRPLIATPAEAAALARAVGSPLVKILFDASHRPIGEGDLAADLQKDKDVIGYHRIVRPPGPGAQAVDLSKLLKLIHDQGYAEPIGLELRAKADPLAAIQAVREADAAAKAL